jgi:hypothetical protein
MKTLATMLGAGVIGMLLAPLFMWVANNTLNGYSQYAGWIKRTLDALL